MSLVTGVALAGPFLTTAGAWYTSSTAPQFLKTPAGVAVKCTEALDNRAGRQAQIEITCVFVNTTPNPQRFVFCMMIDLVEHRFGRDVPGLKRQGYRMVLEGDKLVCKQDSNVGLGETTSYLLGCHFIDIAPFGSQKAVWKTPTLYKRPTGQPPLNPFDFRVKYADTVNVVSNPQTSLDPSCEEALAGQGNFLVPAQAGPGITARDSWVTKDDTVFNDPFVRYQAPGVQRASDGTEYARTTDLPCVPQAIPERSPPQPRCPRRAGRAPPFFEDLNLYWFGSASAPRTESFPTTLRISTTGSLAGLRLVSRPAAGRRFAIPGGENFYGSLGFCAAAVRSRCLGPTVPEGRRVRVEVEALDPEGNLRFDQGLEFVQDTRTPVVRSLSLQAVRSRGSVRLHARARAFDSTTGPMAAALWYTANRGRTWTELPLPATTSLFTAAHTRVFSGTSRPLRLSPGATVRTYLAVQDDAGNYDWYGPRFASAPA